MNMNNVCLIGRLTATPELKTTPNGVNVCNFSIAVEDSYKGADDKPVVDYIDCIAWKHNADFLCKWFDKGVRIAITGKLKTRLYEADGKKRKIVEVICNTVEFADGKREANSNSDNVTFDTNDFVPLGDDDTEFPWGN